MILSRTARIRGGFYEKFRNRSLTFSPPGAIIRSNSWMGEEWALRGIEEEWYSFSNEGG
jgi:hypothetical protein